MSVKVALLILAAGATVVLFVRARLSGPLTNATATAAPDWPAVASTAVASTQGPFILGTRSKVDIKTLLPAAAGLKVLR